MCSHQLKTAVVDHHAAFICLQQLHVQAKRTLSYSPLKNPRRCMTVTCTICFMHRTEVHEHLLHQLAGQLLSQSPHEALCNHHMTAPRQDLDLACAILGALHTYLPQQLAGQLLPHSPHEAPRQDSSQQHGPVDNVWADHAWHSKRQQQKRQQKQQQALMHQYI